MDNAFERDPLEQMDPSFQRGWIRAELRTLAQEGDLTALRQTALGYKR